MLETDNFTKIPIKYAGSSLIFKIYIFFSVMPKTIPLLLHYAQFYITN
jgi:hypothetical protein